MNEMPLKNFMPEIENTINCLSYYLSNSIDMIKGLQKNNVDKKTSEEILRRYFIRQFSNLGELLLFCRLPNVQYVSDKDIYDYYQTEQCQAINDIATLKDTEGFYLVEKMIKGRNDFLHKYFIVFYLNPDEANKFYKIYLEYISNHLDTLNFGILSLKNKLLMPNVQQTEMTVEENVEIKNQTNNQADSFTHQENHYNQLHTNLYPSQHYEQNYFNQSNQENLQMPIRGIAIHLINKKINMASIRQI